MLFLYILGLLLCFFLLAKVCEQYFVQSLDILSNKLRLSSDVAGATLMAVGSSAPELFTSMIALTKVGAEQMGAGTIVGSAIFNVLVIVGASAVVATAYLNWQPVIRDLMFYIIAILLLLFTFRDGQITFLESLFYVAMYAGYILFLMNWSKFVCIKSLENHIPKKAIQQEYASEKPEWIMRIQDSVDVLLGPIMPDLKKNPEKYLYVFFLSILLIGGISWCLVELAVLIAHQLHIPNVIVALTILAAGTSVPDLLSSLLVAKQGRGGMAVGNAVGSNTFDILIGLGLPWFLYIVWTQRNVNVSTENLLSSIFLLFCTVITLLMILAMQKFNLHRWSGWLLIVLYVLYVGWNVWSVM